MKLLKKLSILILLVFLFTGVAFAVESKKETVNIAILGYGTVGSGVKEIVNNNYANIERWSGKRVNVKKIFVRETKTELLNSSDIFTSNIEEILNDSEIKIVVESMGGLDPAYDFVKRSLKNGKDVVTPNKALVATHGAELLQIAEDNKLSFKFEASVGGGIPIIGPIIKSLNANNINQIYGILNGTTNFILTKMINENLSFEIALKTAQELGYAEADPTADVEGLDARNKICILASIAYGQHIYPENVHAEGITKILLDDVGCAEDLGYVIKLIGNARKDSNRKISVFVAPMLVPNSNLLSVVDDVFNAVLVDGDCTGEIMLYGKGAGKLPTASAVVSDIIECINNSVTPKRVYWKDSKNSDILNNFEDFEAPFYIRFEKDGKEELFITEKMKVKDFNEYAKYLENLGFKVLSKIMVLE
ncbi:MAG: homoserine dehydrogenase [Firmicutes bacterium]|nr:homoserine dehydrogenase [Bacillota bacterium]